MMRTCTIVALLFLCFSDVFGQNYRSRQDGDWNDATTWEVFTGGVWQDLELTAEAIPSSASGTITIQDTHNVSIPGGFSVTIDETTIDAGGRISVQGSGTLTIANTASALIVNGELLANQSSSITGTNGTNVVFNAGAVYFHFFSTTQGVIPRAAWNADSELQIRGYTTFTTASAAGNWTQSFGHVTWNCASQTSNLNLIGLLRTINGDFRIMDTNTGRVTLSSNQRPTINIAGDFILEGSSAVTISTSATGSGTIVNVGGDFVFTPTNSSVSQLTTTGNATMNITGNFEMDASGSTFYIANSSTGGTGTLNIEGNFSLESGTVQEGTNNASASTGRINFVNSGVGKTHTFYNAGSIANRIAYRLVSPDDVLRVIGESQLMGHTNSSFTLSGGTLIVESTATGGAIQTGSGAGLGNIRVATRTFSAGSTIIYAGTGEQEIGNGQTSTTDVVIDNPSGVSLNNTSLTTVTLQSLTITQGNLTVANDNLSVNGTTSFVTLSGGDLILDTSIGTRSITLRDITLNGGNLLVEQTTGTATVTVNGELDVVNGTVTVNSSTAAALNTFGDINLSGGDINLNSGSSNLTFTVRGDVTGTGVFMFTGANNNVNIFGSGLLSRDFPINTETTLENLVLDRAGATLTVPAELIVTNNFTLSAGNVVVNAALTVGGDLNIADTYRLTFSDQTLELQSQFNNSLFGGELFANAGSTLNLTGSGTVDTLFFATGGNTLGNLLLDRATSGTLLRLTTPLTVTETVTLADGIFQNDNSLTLSAGVEFIRNSAASMLVAAPAGGPYNLVYEGTSLVPGFEADGTLSDVTSNVSGVVTLDDPLTIEGVLTINSGSFTSGANAISINGFYNAGTFNAPSTTLTLVNGDFTNDGTYNRNNGEIIFEGVSTIGGGSTTTFQDFTIAATGDVTGAPLFALAGDFNNLGTFTHNEGTVRFSGTSRQDILGNGTTFHNIDITNSVDPASVSVESVVNLNGLMTLGAGAQFEADGMTDTGVFTILSTGADPSTGGSIGTIPASASVNGDLTVQRFMLDKNTVNHYISSPVSEAQVLQIYNEGIYNTVRWYDETVTGTAGKGYKTAGSLDILVPGRGYLVTDKSNDTVLDYRGPLNNGENQGPVNMNVTHTVTGQLHADGWNLVGNPYPSGIGWGINAGWQRDNIAGTIYVRDMEGSPYYHSYTYNFDDGTGDLPGGIIAMGQAFWVYAEPDNTTVPGDAVLIVNENAKTNGDGGTFYRKAVSSKQLKITLTSSAGAQENTWLKINPDATDDYDSRFDAWQLKNEVINIAIQDNKLRSMLMHTLPRIAHDFSAPLEIEVGYAGEYTISFGNAESFLDGGELYLVDELEQLAIPITSAEGHTFYLDETSLKTGSRFRLTRNPEFQKLSAEFSVSLYPNPASDVLNIHMRGGKSGFVSMIDAKGNVVLNAAVSEDRKIDIAHLPRGVYVVKILSDEGQTIRKIIKE